MVRISARASCVSRIALGMALAAAATPAWADAVPAGNGAGEPVSIDEIIVTATKRAERLQDVPMSVNAVNSATLERMGVQNVSELSQVVPTLNFQGADEARLFNFSIRGIGTESYSVGVEPSVSTIVDGVVYTRVGSIFDGLGDLERVEVLNGPQGTLQGKNASAGAVVFVTKAPNRDRFEGKVEAGLAEHNEYSSKLTLTGPINDKVAYRLFGYYLHQDGVVKNIATNKSVNNVESYGGRGKLLVQPADNVTFTLAADWTYRNADCCAEPIRVGAPAGNVTAAFTGTPVGPDNKYVNLNTQQAGNQKNSGISLTGDIGIGTHTLTTISAYRHYADFAIRDRDGTNAPFTGVTPQQLFNATFPGISAADALTKLQALLVNPIDFSCRDGVCGESNNREKNDTFSEELRIASPTGGMIDYMGGFFYFDSKVERNLTIAGVRTDIPGNVSFPTPTTVTINRDTAYVLADLVTKVHTKNTAFFANVNVHPLDKFTLTGGARWVHDSLDWIQHKVTGPNGDHIGKPIGINPAGVAMAGANVGTPQFNSDRSFSDSAWMGRVSAKYEFTPDLMVYASWARGFKGIAVDADIYVSQADFDAAPVGPEKSRSWEAGFRSQFLDRRATLNVTGYQTTFYGYQTTSNGVDGTGAPVLQSAGKLYTKGIEGEFAVRPIERLRLSGNFLVAHNWFDDLIISGVNVKGGVPLNAPETKWGVAGSYDLPVADWNVNLTGTYTWTSKTLFTNLADANNPNSVWLRPSYGVANATLNLTPPEERYKLTFYVKNLFDKHYVQGLRRISGSVGGGGAVAQYLPRDFDRYFGGTVTVNF